MKFNKILIAVLLFIPMAAFAQPTVKETHNGDRILVVGGGGARGAWGAGYAKYLDSVNQAKDPAFTGYKNVYGTSTGSLMAPLILLRDFAKLKDVYTTINQKTIFNVNPFKQDGKIRLLKAGWRALWGMETIGESDNLHNYMLDNLSDADYGKIKSDNKRYTVAVTNMKNGTLSYECSDNNNRESMINWMWASANEPIFMSYYEPQGKNGDAYVDGGVISNVPLMEALSYASQNDIDVIDVVVNKPKQALGDDTAYSKRDVFDGLLRLLEVFTIQIRNNNIEMAFLQDSLSASSSGGISKKARFDHARSNPKDYVKIYVYYFPPQYFSGVNSINQKELVFDETRMTGLWYTGENGNKDPAIDSMVFDKKGIDALYKKYKSANKNILLK